MNGIDVLFLVLLVPFIIRGIKLGFVVQAAAIIAIVAGTWIAFRFSGLLAQWIGRVWEVSEMTLHIVAFVIILLAAVLVFNLIGRAIEKIVRFALLGWLDKILGAVMGAVKVFLVLGILILLFHPMNLKYHWIDQSVLDGSALYTPIKDAAYVIFPYFKELLA
ncbi:MAG: CvpA family protein [Bacteroidales bacterium]|nr:CvpA family protein [Bacteroidales bacterium]MBQ7467880.1 CvpA family protein [Bacteroidales bacterium]MBQ8461901.1 CvpA family protein [Bacteroidales bacterium]